MQEGRSHTVKVPEAEEFSKHGFQALVEVQGQVRLDSLSA